MISCFTLFQNGMQEIYKKCSSLYLLVITTAPSLTGILTPLGTVHGRNSPIGTRLTHLRKELRIVSLRLEFQLSLRLTFLEFHLSSVQGLLGIQKSPSQARVWWKIWLNHEDKTHKVTTDNCHFLQCGLKEMDSGSVCIQQWGLESLLCSRNSSRY